MSDLNIVVDPEFRDLLPPLAVDEFAMLEHSIITAGRATDPLKTWRGLLLDGHNRLDICQRHGLPYTAIEIGGIADRDHALLWIEKNQLARRDLSDDQRAVLAARVLRRETAMAIGERAKAGRAAGGKATSEQIVERQDRLVDTSSTERSENDTSAATDKPKVMAVDTIIPLRNTRLRTEVARHANIPERKLRSAVEIIKQDPTAEDRILRGETTILEERASLNAAARAAVAMRKVPPPTGRYSCIVIDPPWPMERIERDVRPNQVGFEYPTMSEEELSAYPIADIADGECHLFCWTTQKFWPMAMRLVEQWGFKYTCNFVWHKPGGFQPFGLPQYNCEFVVYAKRGSAEFIDTKQFFTCFNADRREHSRKPDEFYNMVRRVTAGPRIDVFSREKREGFDQHGNETEKFAAVDAVVDAVESAHAVIDTMVRIASMPVGAVGAGDPEAVMEGE